MFDKLMELFKPKRKFGLRWQKQDSRDFVFKITNPRAFENLPPKVDQRPDCPPVYDQGGLGSCTGQAIAGMLHYLMNKLGAKTVFQPSPLFIYWNERAIEGTLMFDAGAMIRDGIKVVNKLGICPEEMWAYDDGPIKFRLKPNRKCYKRALLSQSLMYEAVPQDLNTMKKLLAEGYQIVIGFMVYESFMTSTVAKTGVGPAPKPGEKLLGGHAVVIVGYDDNDDGGRFILRNSWGKGWGQDGYFTLPYQFLLDPEQASDFWTITLMELT